MRAKLSYDLARAANRARRRRLADSLNRWACAHKRVSPRTVTTASGRLDAYLRCDDCGADLGPLPDQTIEARRADNGGLEADLVEAGRQWIADCQWADMDVDDIAELEAGAIARGIARHYAGGLAQFRADSGLEAAA